MLLNRFKKGALRNPMTATNRTSGIVCCVMIAYGVLVLHGYSAAFSRVVPGANPIEDIEYQVLNAVLQSRFSGGKDTPELWWLNTRPILFCITNETMKKQLDDPSGLEQPLNVEQYAAELSNLNMQALRSFLDNNARSHKLTSRFACNIEYDLITLDDEIEAHSRSKYKNRSRQVVWLRLSRPGFDKARSQALVCVSIMPTDVTADAIVSFVLLMENKDGCWRIVDNVSHISEM